MNPATPIGPVPPHSLEAESSLLGALLLDPEAVAVVAPIVSRADFYRAAHGALYGAIVGLSERSEPTDVVAVVRECERLGILEDVGGRTGLADLVASVATAANAPHYAGVVRDYARSRAVLFAAMAAQAAIHDGADVGAVVERLEASLFASARDSGDRPVVTGSEVAARLGDVWEGHAKPEGAVSTGFADLDAVLGGFRAGQLVVVAGSTGMGKTTVAVNIARRAVLEGRTPLLFSLEMSREEVVRNVLAAEAGVATTRLHDSARLTIDDRDALYAAQSRIDLRRLRIQDAPDVTPSRIRSIARRERRLHGIDLVVVDYVQLVAPNGGRRGRESREEEVASVSRALKALAREAGIPVLALAQLNRGPDTRDDHRPRISDLRESAAISHDADVVLGVYRESHFKPDDVALRDRLDLLVLKQRNGPTGRVPLRYRAEIARLDDRNAPPRGDSR